MYKRAEYKVIMSRLAEPRKFIQVVVGARQVGKSTLVKQVLSDLAIPYRMFSADNVPISFENFRIPEISLVNAVLIDRSVEAKLLSDFTAWSASADNCIFRLSTVPSATFPPPNFVRLATIS